MFNLLSKFQYLPARYCEARLKYVKYSVLHHVRVNKVLWRNLFLV